MGTSGHGRARRDRAGRGGLQYRGSEEYNIALGERRAYAVRRDLEDIGVPSSRLELVSLGEAKPEATGHDEAAWQYNRNAQFKMH